VGIRRGVPRPGPWLTRSPASRTLLVGEQLLIVAVGDHHRVRRGSEDAVGDEVPDSGQEGHHGLTHPSPTRRTRIQDRANWAPVSTINGRFNSSSGTVTAGRAMPR
jgi:hypothetical protein